MKFADLHDANIQNRFFFKYATSAPSDADCNTWCAAIRSAWFGGAIPNYISATQNLIETSCEDLSSPTSAVGAHTGSDGGGDVTAPMGAAVCFLVSFVIARRYRGGHPRLYMSGACTDSALDAETVKPATVTALQTAWTTFMGEIAALPLGPNTGTVHVVPSFYSGFTNFTYPSGRTYPRPTLRPTPIVDVVTGVLVSNKFATQRRRLVRS